MKKANVEFVEFESADVIATSGVDVCDLVPSYAYEYEGNYPAAQGRSYIDLNGDGEIHWGDNECVEANEVSSPGVYHRNSTGGWDVCNKKHLAK